MIKKKKSVVLLKHYISWKFCHASLFVCVCLCIHHSIQHLHTWVSELHWTTCLNCLQLCQQETDRAALFCHTQKPAQT